MSEKIDNMIDKAIERFNKYNDSEYILKIDKSSIYPKVIVNELLNTTELMEWQKISIRRILGLEVAQELPAQMRVKTHKIGSI